MKLYKYIWMAALPMIFTACQDDVLEKNLTPAGIYTLSSEILEKGVEGRAQIQFGNDNVEKEYFFWNKNDKFTLFQTIDNVLTGTEFTINENYTEPENGDKTSAFFKAASPVQPNLEYVALYPSTATVNGDDAELSFDETLDFTNADTEEERNAVWKEYLNNNMYMLAQGKLTESGANNVKFEHLCVMARVTYTNRTNEAQTITKIGFGGQIIETSKRYNLRYHYQSGSGGGSPFDVELVGLNVGAGSTTEFYILFFPRKFEGENLEVVIGIEGKGDKRAKIATADIAAVNNGYMGFEAGKRYWFDVTYNGEELIWTKTLGPSVTIENPELSVALLDKLGGHKVIINNQGNAVITEADAKAVTELDFGWNNYQITSLRGVECFPNLTRLVCADTGLTDCDLSKNTKLQHVNVQQNAMTSLDFSKHPDLTELTCSYNENLISLNISACAKMDNLQTQDTGLTELAIPNPEAMYNFLYGNTGLSYDLNIFPNLRGLGCEGRISDESQIPDKIKAQLENLFCGSNGWESIDLSKYSNLHYLNCENNNLTSLDLTKVSELKALSCFGNQMTTLDITALSEITQLYCGNQQNDETLTLTLYDIQQAVLSKDLATNMNSRVVLNVKKTPGGFGQTGGNDFIDGGEF